MTWSRLPAASHRDTDEPQPEVCDLCGLHVGGAHLRLSDVEGLRGQYVCDVTPGCKDFRNRPSWRDRRRWNDRERSTIGDSRVYPAGDEDWADFLTQNLLLWSEEFDRSATWTPTAVTVTADTALSPDDTTTGDTLTDSSSPSAGRVIQSVSLTEDEYYTFSVHIKRTIGDSHYAYFLASWGLGNSGALVINTNNGTVSLVDPTDSVLHHAVGSRPNDWMRVELGGQASSGGSPSLALYPAWNRNGGNTHQTGTTGAKEFWGAQLNRSLGAHPYTITTAAVVDP